MSPYFRLRAWQAFDDLRRRLVRTPPWLKRLLVVFLLVVLIPLLIAAVAPFITEGLRELRERRVVVVHGAVTDERQRGVQGAVVRLAGGDLETVTGPDGGFTLRVEGAKRGRVLHLRTVRAGYRPADLQYTVGDETAWIVLEAMEPDQGSVLLCHWNAGLEEITLCNPGGAAVDLEGWTLSDGEGSYRIPAGTILEGGERWTITIEDYNPRKATGALRLNDEHDQIRLTDGSGTLMDEVAW